MALRYTYLHTLKHLVPLENQTYRLQYASEYNKVNFQCIYSNKIEKEKKIYSDWHIQTNSSIMLHVNNGLLELKWCIPIAFYHSFDMQMHLQ